MGAGGSVVAGRIPLLSSQEVQTDPWEPPVTIAHHPAVGEQKTLVPAQAHELQSKAPDTVGPEDVWLKVDETLEVPKGGKNPYDDLVVKRSGWKTIRIFVSSTFKDFHYEREVLVKEVFPDLRAWCEQRRLHLVECDLRWGVPKDSTTELTLKTCLGEIDRCYQDNIMPFFLNMTSERIGWIPVKNEVPGTVVDEYRWIFGLSMTEMEIVHGAYRKDNPNSFFLLREDSFLTNVPQDRRPEFVDEQVIANEKLKILRKMIEDRFPPERILRYKSVYSGEDQAAKKLQFTLDDGFRSAVFEFFKKRIDHQYPLYDGEEDPLERSREAHEAFMKSRGESVLGRQEILKQINDYVTGEESDVPLLILGQPGTGKSSIMAKAADDTTTLALDKKLPHGGQTGWLVFHHFVGAVPGSTDLLSMLCRLLREIKFVDETTMPTDLDSAVNLAMSALNNPSTRPVILFVDALNQLNEDTQAIQCNWVPRKLPRNIRCVFSMINSSPPHVNLMARESKPKEMFVPPLSLAIRKDMVTEYLGKYNKKLDIDQMFGLLTKTASENPLWLSIACEELRVFGNFRQVSDKINNLPDGLLDLLMTVLHRFEVEGGGHLLIATLCLIEVSSFGLLESELLTILADEDNLLPPEGKVEKGKKDSSKKENRKKDLENEKLPAIKWAAVYRSLRTFLRPFGDSGEGRLDFYHRTLSKVVRKKYLKETISEEQGETVGAEATELQPAHKWWHSKLADYFELSENMDRKVEEYPYHLIKLKDTQRLETFLCDWNVIDGLYDVDISLKLIRYWQMCGGAEAMVMAYSEMLTKLKEECEDQTVVCWRYEQIGRIMTQAGMYEHAKTLADEALRLEVELGSRNEKMADIYSLLAYVIDQIMKQKDYAYRSDITPLRNCLDYQMKAIEIYKQLPQDRKCKLKTAKMLISHAFTGSSFAQCGGDENLSSREAITQALDHVEQAMVLCKELNNNGLLAEAIMTKAVLSSPQSLQKKLYTEAEELCMTTFGMYHPLMMRIHMNFGICWEELGDYNKAFDYFRKNYEIALEVFGKDHITVKRPIKILVEPMYKRIAMERGKDIPS